MKKKLVVSVCVIAMSLLSMTVKAAEGLDFYVGYKQVEEGTLEADHFLELGLENEVRTKGFRQIKMTLDQLSIQLDQIIKSEVIKRASRGSLPKTSNGGSAFGSVNTSISTQVIGVNAGNAKSKVAIDSANVKVDPNKDTKPLKAKPLKEKPVSDEALVDKKINKEYAKFNPNFKARDYSVKIPPKKDNRVVAVQAKIPKVVALTPPKYELTQEMSPPRTHEAPRERSLMVGAGAVTLPSKPEVVKEQKAEEKISPEPAQVRNQKTNRPKVSLGSEEKIKNTPKAIVEKSLLLKAEESSERVLPPKESVRKSDPCIESEVVDDVFRAMSKIKVNTDESVFIAAQEYESGTASCLLSFRKMITLAKPLGCEKGDFTLAYKGWDGANEPHEKFFEREKRTHSSIAAWLESPSNQLQPNDSYNLVKILRAKRDESDLPEQELSKFCVYVNYLRIVSYSLRYRNEAMISQIKEHEENEKKGKGSSGSVILLPGAPIKSKPAAAPAPVPKKHPG